MLDDFAEPQRSQIREARGSRNRHPHRPVRNGLPHADQRARSDRLFRRARVGPRHVRPPGARARHLCLQLPHGPPPRRTRRPLSSSHARRLGPAQQPDHRTCTPSAATPTSRAPPSSRDLKMRGLLDDTLVIWGGEFGRTPFIQGNLGDRPRWGRDHHPYAFTVWMAGGGVRPGIPTAPPTTSASMNVENPSMSTTSRPPCSTCWHRPRKTHLPLPGPLLPPHRRPRPRINAKKKRRAKRRLPKARAERGNGVRNERAEPAVACCFSGFTLHALFFLRYCWRH
jgi:hypothetical protein